MQIAQYVTNYYIICDTGYIIHYSVLCLSIILINTNHMCLDQVREEFINDYEKRDFIKLCNNN